MSVRMVLTLLLCLSWGSPTMAQHRVQLHPTGTVSQRTLLQVQNGTMEFANDSALPLSELYSFGQLRQQANRGWVVLRHGEVLVALLQHRKRRALFFLSSSSYPTFFV